MTLRLVATLCPHSAEDAEGPLTDPPPGVDYLELRLDHLARAVPEEVVRLMRMSRTLPVIATCRSEADGGRFAGSTEERLALLVAAAEAGADLIDVEEELFAQLPENLPGRTLLSLHLTRFVPRLDALARRLLRHGADFTKLAVPADTPRALAGLLALQEEFGDELAVVPTGRLAEAGRVMSAGRGATLTYAALDDNNPGHHDQPSLERLHGLMQIGTVSGSTRFFAVVGSPIGHSLSPLFHNGAFRAVATNARMVVLDVDKLSAVVQQAEALRLDGLAVTHPFKTEAIELADAVMPGARLTGAANTLRHSEAGWQARNTDWKAAADLLPRLLREWSRREQKPEWLAKAMDALFRGHRETHVEPSDGEPLRVLLLGAGGAARAVAVALYEEPVELGIWSRRRESAQALADQLATSLSAKVLPDPESFPADMVVNATPAGMPGVVPEGLLALGPEVFREGGFAVDLTYGGGASPFREAAHEAGVPVIGGEIFFALQARSQAAVFTGAPLPRDLARELAQRCGAPV
ncbi:MAG: hypothetical protein DHS20C15_11050 [Planctomycetota bacterium]|nr:MAG: hypothetical protein DHS20C15_11050 [Planctomycetota bacterium]